MSLKNYTFIVVEAGKASDFTHRRICRICKKWCQSDESIRYCSSLVRMKTNYLARCESCNSDFHKSCVNMPRKPPKGYVWQCLTCSRPELKRDETPVEKESEPMITGPSPDTDSSVKSDNTLVNAETDPVNPEPEKVSKVGRPRKKKYPLEKFDKVINGVPRGLKDEIIFNHKAITEAALNKFLEDVGTDSLKDKSEITYLSLLELHKCDYDAQRAKEAMENTVKDSTKLWTDEERKSVSLGIQNFGHDLHAIHKQLKNKTMKDLVQYFYIWKKTEEYQTCYAKFCMKNRPGF
ncbi:Mesoderm induction early response protein 3 [Dinochytrium kinnereticum]|nr:Mesoderm induction early response protein 3 [Dinochytrium kinnereticum]